MGSDKKDLEIIYNLEWKNGNAGQRDKSNIVGMYDIPSTTLNWETFKSYLLKNSGAGVDDVRVSYVRSDDKEFPIVSQLDFQIALYSFRQRARNDEVITLRLDRVSDHKAVGSKRQRQSTEEECLPAALPSDEVPVWFKRFMKGFKRDLVEEVTISVINVMSNAKQMQARKAKEVATSKRSRRPGDTSEKDFRKSLKIEHKIEELDERTHKTEILCTAESKDDNVDSDQSASVIPLLGASAIGPGEVKLSHMVGGQIFRQKWAVSNTGSVPWTVETDLRYAWGSEALRPLEKSVSVPLLKPGEKGHIVVLLEVPRIPGEYECYWHFSHGGFRFGQWLGCHLTVDPSPIKLVSSHHYNSTDKQAAIESSPIAPSPTAEIDDEAETSVAAVASTLEDLALAGSDSDNQSVISISDSTSSENTTHSDGFVVVPIESEVEAETIKVDPIKLEPLKMEPIKVEAKRGSAYAYVTINGKRHAVSKGLLRRDYLETAEDAPTPEGDQKRLFVFPLNCPGFEVVYPPNQTSAKSNSSEKTAASDVTTEAKLENERTANKVDGKKEQPRMVPLAGNGEFASPLPMYPGTIPVYPAAMGIPSMAIPATAINIPVATASPHIGMPPVFAYSGSSSPTQGWYYSPGNTSTPQFADYGLLSNSAYGFPYMLYTYGSDGYASQTLSSQNAGIPAGARHPFEGDKPPTSLNNESGSVPLRIIPETFVSGAANVASSASNIARSVLNMFTAAHGASPMPPTPQAQPTTQAQQMPLTTQMPPTSQAQPLPQPRSQPKPTAPPSAQPVQQHLPTMLQHLPAMMQHFPTMMHQVPTMGHPVPTMQQQVPTMPRQVPTMPQQVPTMQRPAQGGQPQEAVRVPPTRTPREKAHHVLRAMGFWDRHTNDSLLDRFHDDVPRVVAELVM